MSTSSETADIPSRPKKWGMLLSFLLLPLAVILKMGLFFLLIGMLPTLLAYALIRNTKTYAISTVAAFNFAGIFPDLLGICMQSGTPRALTDKLMDLSVWLSVYGAAALGWAIVWLSPSIAMLFFEEIYRSRLRHLEHLQKKLEDEWGPQIKGSE